VLVGSDKTDDSSGWFERNIPPAGDLHDEHPQNLKERR